MPHVRQKECVLGRGASLQSIVSHIGLLLTTKHTALLLWLGEFHQKVPRPGKEWNALSDAPPARARTRIRTHRGN